MTFASIVSAPAAEQVAIHRSNKEVRHAQVLGFITGGGQPPASMLQASVIRFDELGVPGWVYPDYSNTGFVFRRALPSVKTWT